VIALVGVPPGARDRNQRAALLGKRPRFLGAGPRQPCPRAFHVAASADFPWRRGRLAGGPGGNFGNVRGANLSVVPVKVTESYSSGPNLFQVVLTATLFTLPFQICLTFRLGFRDAQPYKRNCDHNQNARNNLGLSP
jgi:hypothetical protein